MSTVRDMDRAGAVGPCPVGWTPKPDDDLIPARGGPRVRDAGREVVIDAPAHSWMRQGACLDSTIDFTANRLGRRQADRDDPRRKVCNTCPVAAQCAAYAAQVEPAAGYWAGRQRGRQRILDVAAATCDGL